MSSPSALIKVNYLAMRYLYLRSVRGDLQEGHDYASWCQSPLFQSTKSAFLCSSYRRRLRGCWPGGGKYGLGEEKSAHVLGLRAFTNLSCCSECRSTRSAILLGVPPHHLLARKRRARERRAGARSAGERKPGNESRGTKAGARSAGERRASGFTVCRG